MADLFTHVIETKTAKQFASLGMIASARVQSEAAGLIVCFEMNGKESVLGKPRGGEIRYFKSIDGAASVLKQLGVMEISMNLQNWIPRSLRKGDE